MARNQPFVMFIWTTVLVKTEKGGAKQTVLSQLSPDQQILFNFSLRLLEFVIWNTDSKEFSVFPLNAAAIRGENKKEPFQQREKKGQIASPLL